jgi:hypothetical protein
MPVEFYDSGDERVHDEFQNWRSRNTRGFFINVKSPTELMLHRSECSHPGDTEWKQSDSDSWGSLTRSRKVCSTDRSALDRWIADNARAATLSKCKTCRPE